MGDKKVKPLKVKTKQIDKELNKAYKKDLGGETLTKNNEKVIAEEMNKTEDIAIGVEQEDKSTEVLESDEKVARIEEGVDELEKLKKENEMLKDLLARKSAELDNFIKRTLKEKNELIDYANQSLLLKFLPLLDDFAKALEAGKKGSDCASLLKGIEMIYDKAIKTFSEAGVKRMEINPGDDFNVELHEALMQMPSEEYAEGKIVQVAEDGYLLKDRVLRHAKVLISSGNQNN